MVYPKLVGDVFDEIAKEIERAQELYPKWPTNLIEATAIVSEKSGEALKEALNLRACERPGRGSLPKLRTELLQTAAMAVRALINLPA
jgi:hypothetical protein